MSILESMLTGVKTAAVIGHIHPDGDCVGSCLAVYNYLENIHPEIEVVVYLEEIPSKFNYLKNFEKICHDFTQNRQFDLCICLDSSDKLRFGEAVNYLDNAKTSICIDHHVTNLEFAQENVVEPQASSTCEVLYGLLKEEGITKEVAECIYTGIVHDTGVFKYDCTSARTMEIAGKMMAKGIDFPNIIDNSFYRKTFVQNQVLGKALMGSTTILDGTCIYSVISKKDMDFYGITSADTDGIVDQLRITEGVECAIFIYETETDVYKVSLRSTKGLDVSRIAVHFGGGGHIKAAGCTISGNIQDVISNLSDQLVKQMN
jgi:phosphoesterase RecJ-like protein